MEAGFYPKNPPDFKSLRVPFFIPHKNELGYSGCGANTLALILGQPSVTFVRANGSRAHYSDEFMVRQLEKYGCRVFPLTKCAVSLNGYDTQIHPDHLVMASQLMMKHEGSWTVTHNHHIYHNYGKAKLSPLEFLNRPTMNVYLVAHDIWKDYQSCPTILQAKR